MLADGDARDSAGQPGADDDEAARELMAHASRAWGFRSRREERTVSSLLAFGDLEGSPAHSPAVVKVPIEPDEVVGSRAHGWWAGTGAPIMPLLAEHPGVLLMPEGGESLGARLVSETAQAAAAGGGFDAPAGRAAVDRLDDDALLTAAALVRELHEAPQPELGWLAEAGVPTLQEVFEPLLGLDVRSEPVRRLVAAPPRGIARSQLDPARIPGLLADARSVARDLLGDPSRPRVLLHGDVHHGNVLALPEGLAERDWALIDPKGSLGDPAYDIANLFCNPSRELAVDRRRLDRRQRLGAEVLGVDLDAVRAFTLMHAALSCAWSLEDGDWGLPHPLVMPIARELL